MRFNVNDIDNGITLRLEEVTASLGYWPDLTVVNPTNQVDMENAITTIKNSRKTPIMVYRPNSSRNRINNNFNSIFVNRKYYKNGDIGFGHSIDIEVENPSETDPALKTFRKVKHSDITCDIEYQIRFICADDTNHDVLDKIVFTAFQNRMFVDSVSDARVKLNHKFLVISSGTPTDVQTDDRVERVYRFDVKDVIISDAEVLKTGIKAINTITVELQTGSDMDNLETIN